MEWGAELSKKGTYLGGNSVLKPGSEWFSADKGKSKGKNHKRLQKRLSQESSKHLRENPIMKTPIPGDVDPGQERLKIKRLKAKRLKTIRKPVR